MSTEAYELAEAKLASSGLDFDDAMELGIEILDGSETAALCSIFRPVPSLKFPYFHPITRAPMTGFPHWPQFYRVRFLKDPDSDDFGGQGKKDKKKKIAKYMQEPDTSVCAYFARTQDWSILEDWHEPLIITEGELKAAKACKEGYPTIGLGGVHSFKSNRWCVPFLLELEAIVWPRRYVYIIFDSDFRTNQNICLAMQELAEELAARGAIPHIVPLPQLGDEDQKTGLDDYLVEHPGAQLGMLLKTQSIPLTLARSMWQLNSQFTYVMNPGMVVDHRSGQKLSTSAFKDHVTAVHVEQQIQPTGGLIMRKVQGSHSWMKWPLRREATRLTYAPGQPEEIAEAHGMALNTWSGWAYTPIKGDHQPFLDLVDHLFTGAAKGDKEWFLRWCAYPLQFPGVKLFTTVAIHGIKHGTGKSLVGYTLGDIYGKNFSEINQKTLHSDFNDWANGKQFVLADDITGSDRRADADMIKKLITQQQVRINEKFVPAYSIPDCINYIWTSNQPDAFFIEDHDRRLFVHEVTAEPMAEEFYVDYTLWRSGGGAAHVFDYLMKLDLEDFNPSAPARATMAKQRMHDDVQSDLGSWVRALRANPDNLLRMGATLLKGDLFTNKQLLMLYDPEGKTRTTANGLGRELRRAGMTQILDGMPVKTSTGQDRYYALRNKDKWLKADRQAVLAHLEEGSRPGRAKKF